MAIDQLPKSLHCGHGQSRNVDFHDVLKNWCLSFILSEANTESYRRHLNNMSFLDVYCFHVALQRIFKLVKYKTPVLLQIKH